MKQFLQTPFATTTGNETLMTNGELIGCIAAIILLFSISFVLVTRKAKREEKAKRLAQNVRDWRKYVIEADQPGDPDYSL